MATFDSAIFYLDALGLTQVILPFILVFTVIFAILMKVAIFQENGKPSRKFNSIIALAMALLTVIPHITGRIAAESDPVIIINAFLPGAVVLTIVLLIFLMLVGFLGGKTQATDSPLVAIAGGASVIVLIFVLWRALYPSGTPSWLSFLDDSNLQAVVVIILIMGIIVYYVTSDPGEKKKSYADSLKELFGGK